MKKLFVVALTLMIISQVLCVAVSATTMFALDGRTIWIDEKDIAEYEKVGWYEQPPVTMYSLDGRTITVAGEQVDAYKMVGWYEYSPMTVYSLDGRSYEICKYQLSEWKKVGWYEQPPVTMYSLDGRTITVPGEQIEAYKKVGWYTTNVLEAYKAAYGQVLKNAIRYVDVYSDASFSLAYIDGDNIPELVYCLNTCHAAGVDIYTFRNEEAVNISTGSSGTWGAFGSNGMITYLPKGNVFSSYYSGMGYVHETIYNITNGKAVEVCEFEIDATNENNSIYYVNDKKVSYSSYMSKRNSYGYSDNYVATPANDSYALTYQNIKNVFGV